MVFDDMLRRLNRKMIKLIKYETQGKFTCSQKKFEFLFSRELTLYQTQQ